MNAQTSSALGLNWKIVKFCSSATFTVGGVTSPRVEPKRGEVTPPTTAAALAPCT